MPAIRYSYRSFEVLPKFVYTHRRASSIRIFSKLAVMYQNQTGIGPMLHNSGMHVYKAVVLTLYELPK